MDNQPTFEAFLAARQGALLRTAWLLTGDWQLAEDLVQTALVKVWPRWARVCSLGSPDAYVRRVLVTTFVSQRRRRWLGERQTEQVPEPPDRVDPIGAVDLRDALERVLRGLAPRQRAVLILRYYEDLSEIQTAEVLGCSVGTVKSQASKALARLREEMSAATSVEEAR